ncbi:MAG: GNAT family N-acetyltransferase [Parachlamydiales bacterium]|nr:GNAT family N-acetyltransferase [Parachlamydiales bacterium]
MNLTIKLAVDEDFTKIWEIFRLIVKTGDTISFAPETTIEEAKKYWMNDGMHTYKAVIDNEIVGTYVLKPNFPGLGSHVANAGYMVHPDYQGKKISTQMIVHSLEEARRLGFKAMQYNLVVSTNIPAVKLYQKIGFKIVGQIPKAFNHLKLGFVDAYIMHRFL